MRPLVTLDPLAAMTSSPGNVPPVLSGSADNEEPYDPSLPIDSNKDGQVSYKELEAGFKAIDKDGNEILDKDEIRAVYFFVPPL